MSYVYKICIWFKYLNILWTVFNVSGTFNWIQPHHNFKKEEEEKKKKKDCHKIETREEFINIISSNERTPNYNVLCFNNSGHAKENPKARSRRFHPIICGSASSDAISSPVEDSAVSQADTDDRSILFHIAVIFHGFSLLEFQMQGKIKAY